MKFTKWNEEMINFLKSNYKTKSFYEIGESLDISYRAVQHKANKLNLRRKTQNWTEEEVRFLIENKNLLTKQEIANHLGKTKSSIGSKIGDLGIGKTPRKYTYNKEFFKNIDTEEKAYWLGFIMADGCVSKREDYESYRFRLALKEEDFTHLEKFVKCIDGNNEVLHKKSIYNNSVYEYCKVDVYSSEFSTHLVNLGVVPNKTKSFSHPKIKDELFKFYLRGYFDGDGCLYFNENLKTRKFSKSVEIACFSIEPMEEIRDILLKYNINSKVYKTKEGRNSKLMISNFSDMRKFLDFIYDEAKETCKLDRKFEKYKKFIELIDKDAV
ncbi:MAG: LAGLIDADG family homing endonuclease [Clostridia bacterium]